MKVKLIAFGIAKDILRGNQTDIEFDQAPTIGEIKEELINQFSDFAALRSLKFAVNEDYQNDDFQVSEGDEIVIIPPVSGG